MVDRRHHAALVLATLLGLMAVADLVRCGIGVTRIGGPSETVLLFASGGLAAVGSVITAGGAVRRRRWALWSATLIGLASAPQAAMTGFRPPYTIPDLATAVLGVLLTVGVMVGSPREGVEPGALQPLACPFEPVSCVPE